MVSLTPETRRAGESATIQALVLGQIPFGERDLVVRLLTAEEGKISALAKNAANSKRRFGAAIDPANFISAHLVVPRDAERGAGVLWRFDKADLRESFLHLRSSYAKLDSALFAVALMRDLVPDALPDPNLFRGLGRFLRDLQAPETDRLGVVPRLAYWSWAAQRLGYGDLASETHLFESFTPLAVAAWSRGLALKVPDFAQLWPFLASQKITAPRAVEVEFYRKWVAITGMSWPHFERWAGLFSLSSR